MEDQILAATSIESSFRQETTCIACRQRGAHVFFTLNGVPVLCNAPCATREAALRFPMGQIELAYCSYCGLVFNCAFAPESLSYNQQYENSLHYSPRFDDYIRSLASDLVGLLNLRDKDIIEIGCGKGDFLALLCELGDNRGIGFDPTYESDRLAPAAGGKLKIVRELYTEAYGHLACDLLCCRQTLEHIPEPAEFLRTIRRALGKNHNNTVVFFEVPNALYTLRHRGIWDIIYEHVSYFWSAPLSRLFADCGFSWREVRQTYGGQFLCIEAVPNGASAGLTPCADGEQLDRVAEEARVFGDTFRSTVQAATSVLEEIDRNRQRAVIWGAGSKGVTFLNIFKNFTSLEYAVDINPHKQGKYIPGTGQAIVAPEFLLEYKPDAVFVMNPLYRQEIDQRFTDLSVSPRLITV